jgi:hypothetical protein
VQDEVARIQVVADRDRIMPYREPAEPKVLEDHYRMTCGKFGDEIREPGDRHGKTPVTPSGSENIAPQRALASRRVDLSCDLILRY